MAEAGTVIFTDIMTKGLQQGCAETVSSVDVMRTSSRVRDVTECGPQLRCMEVSTYSDTGAVTPAMKTRKRDNTGFVSPSTCTNASPSSETSTVTPATKKLKSVPLLMCTNACPSSGTSDMTPATKKLKSVPPSTCTSASQSSGTSDMTPATKKLKCVPLLTCTSASPTCETSDMTPAKKKLICVSLSTCTNASPSSGTSTVTSKVSHLSGARTISGRRTVTRIRRREKIMSPHQTMSTDDRTTGKMVSVPPVSRATSHMVTATVTGICNRDKTQCDSLEMFAKADAINVTDQLTPAIARNTTDNVSSTATRIYRRDEPDRRSSSHYNTSLISPKPDGQSRIPLCNSLLVSSQTDSQSNQSQFPNPRSSCQCIDKGSSQASSGGSPQLIGPIFQRKCEKASRVKKGV